MEGSASTGQGQDQGQGKEQQDNRTSNEANPRQSNTQPQQQSEAGQQATVATATAQAPAPIPAPDLNAIPQGDLANLSLQGLSSDLNLMPMLGPDGNILSDQDLMNMPLMMPMMLDASGMMNIPSMPQNNITNGTLLSPSADQGRFH